MSFVYFGFFWLNFRVLVRETFRQFNFPTIEFKGYDFRVIGADNGPDDEPTPPPLVADSSLTAIVLIYVASGL